MTQRSRWAAAAVGVASLAFAVLFYLPLPAAKPNEAPRFILLVLDRAGQAFVNDQPVTQDALARQLAQTAAQNPDTEVQLRADEAVPYGRVVELMGAAQKAGLNRIGFMASPQQKMP